MKAKVFYFMLMSLLTISSQFARAEVIDDAFHIGEVGPGGGIIFITPNSAGKIFGQDWANVYKDSEIVGDYFEIAAQELPELTAWCDSEPKDWYQFSYEPKNTPSSEELSELIAKKCKFSAAGLAISYNGGGKRDWFLPSTQILSQFIYSGLTKTLQGERYWWTNFMYDPYNKAATFIYFKPNFGSEGHIQGVGLIQNLMSVRPVRIVTKAEISEKLAINAGELKAKQEAEAMAAADLKAKQEAEAMAAADLKVRKEIEAKAALLKKSTITCVKGKLTKKVTALKPKCPSGYKVKK